MAKAARYTLEEIIAQPESWAKTTRLMTQLQSEITRLWQAQPWSQVLWTGCGSSHYLSLAAAALFQQLTGRPARGVPASELWLYPKSSLPAQGDILLFAVSRSGQTTEVLHAVEQFRASRRGRIVTITCDADSPLYSMGELNIALTWAQEKSITQTGSFASIYLAATALATICAGRQDLLTALQELVAIGERLISQHRTLMHDLGASRELERFYFLGSGPRYGLACESSLKMKEMSLTHAEPFHFLEFRHGPKSMVNERTLVVGLLSEDRATYEAAVLKEMSELGGKTLVLAEGVKPAEADNVITFSSGLSEEVRGVLYLPALQLLACERALSKGLNPDAPAHLDAVVRLTDV